MKRLCTAMLLSLTVAMYGMEKAKQPEKQSVREVVRIKYKNARQRNYAAECHQLRAELAKQRRLHKQEEGINYSQKYQETLFLLAQERTKSEKIGRMSRQRDSAGCCCEGLLTNFKQEVYDLRQQLNTLRRDHKEDLLLLYRQKQDLDFYKHWPLRKDEYQDMRKKLGKAEQNLQNLSATIGMLGFRIKKKNPKIKNLQDALYWHADQQEEIDRLREEIGQLEQKNSALQAYNNGLEGVAFFCVVFASARHL